MLFLLVRKPEFQGASECRHLTPATLQSEVIDAPEKQSWLVMYTAAWNDDCNYVFPIFSELSAQCVMAPRTLGEVTHRTPPPARRRCAHAGSTPSTCILAL